MSDEQTAGTRRDGHEDELVDPDELGLDELIDTGPEESVGLDDSTGLEDEGGLFQLEVPPDDAGGVDDDDIDLIPVEGLDTREEYGWTADNEAGSADPMAPEDVDIPALPPLGADDGGEEGVEETFELAPLPARRDDLADEEGTLGDDVFPDPMAALARLVEETDTLLDLVVPEAPAVESEHVPPACTLLSVDASPPTLAGGVGVYRVGEAGLAPLGDEALGRATVTAVLRDGDHVLVGVDATSVLFSRDGGETFAAAAGLERADASDGRLQLIREPGTQRVWACTASGALLLSVDGGETFSGPLLLRRVAAVAATEGWIYALSIDPEGRSQLARSSDGGQRWAASDGPTLAPDATVHLAAVGAAVALSAPGDDKGPFLSRNGGRTFARLPGIGTTGALALVREGDRLTLYAAHRAADGRELVARHRPDGGESVAVLDLGAPDGSAGDRIYAVVAAAADALTELAVTTDRGLFRVRVRPEELE